jgi:cell wall assembly regulator SMI1
LGIAIPMPLRELLSQHDGTPGHSGVDDGWIRVWSISEWSNPVHEAEPARRFVGLAFFADWGISSDEYYFDGVPRSATYGQIFVGEVAARRRIAESFTEFLAFMLEGNTRALW